MSSIVKYKRKQIDLPYESAAKMTREQLEQLIVTQGRRIPLLDWEIGLLIKDCTEKSCLPKGLAILYEYAGYLDTVKRLVDIRHETAVALLERPAGSSSADSDVSALLENLANVNMNLLINMGNLRALQWSPRSILTPVTVPLKPNSGNSNSERSLDMVPEHSVSGKRVPVEACLKQEAAYLQRVFEHRLKSVPEHCAAILLAPELEYERMAKFMSDSGATFGDWHALVRAIGNIVSIEQDITTAYKVIRTASKSGEMKHGGSPFNDLPTMRLNYPEFVPNATYLWFGQALEVYSPSVVTLLAVTEALGIPRTRLSAAGGKKASSTKDRGVSGAKREEDGAGGLEGAAAVTKRAVDSPLREGAGDPFAESDQLVISSSGKNIVMPLPSSVREQLERSQTAADSKHPNAEDDHPYREVKFQLSTSASTSPVTSPVAVMRPGRDQPGSGSMVRAPPLGSPNASTAGGATNRKRSNSTGYGRAEVSGAILIQQEATALPALGVKYHQDSEEKDEGMFQTSPVRRLAGPAQEAAPIEFDFSYIGAGGIGSGAHVGSPSKGDKKGLSPSKRPDIKKRVGLQTTVGSTLSTRSAIRKNRAIATGTGSTRQHTHKASEKKPSRLVRHSVLSTKASDTLSFMSLASGPTIGFSRSESRAEGQILQINMRDAKVSGKALVELAARKICHWWFFLGPKRKLARRQSNAALVRSIVIDVAHEVALKCIKKRRTKTSLLRNGSAITIQRQLKYWFFVVRRRQRPVEGWGNPPLMSSQSFASGGLEPDPITPRLQASFSGDRQQRVKTRARTVAVVRTRSDLADKSSGGRRKIRWNKSKAATCINGFFRIILAKKKIVEQEKIVKEYRKMKKQRLNSMSPHKAATIIQKMARGGFARDLMFRVVKASMIISHSWKRHLAFKRLRADLRRVDKPRYVRLTSVNNLPRQFSKTREMSIRVSAFWGGLLHVFESESEQRLCIKGKKPQYIGQSSSQPVVKTGSVAAWGRKSSFFLPKVDTNPEPSFSAGASALETYQANFNGELLRIPGVHGNAVLIFDFLADNVSVGDSMFFMMSHGELMCWDKTMSSHLNYKVKSTAIVPVPNKSEDSEENRAPRLSDLASLDKDPAASRRSGLTAQSRPQFDLSGPRAELLWRLDSGNPFFSRCGQVKVYVHRGVGSGPVINAFYKHFGILSTLVTNWQKVYISFNGDELAVYENRHTSQPIHVMTLDQIDTTYLQMGRKTGGNAMFEDNFDLCIKMLSHRELLRLRFSDPGSRVRWNEALAYALRGYKSFKTFSKQAEDASDASGEQYGDVRETNNFVGRATMIMSSVKSKVNPLLNLVDEDGAVRTATAGRKRRASAFANSLQAQLLQHTLENQEVRPSLMGSRSNAETDTSDEEESTDSD